MLLSKGNHVLIRTVTMFHIGEVEDIVEVGGSHFVQLSSASWIANTGRFSDCLQEGKLEEVEPFPAGCEVAMAAIVDIAPWEHELPTEQI